MNQAIAEINRAVSTYFKTDAFGYIYIASLIYLFFFEKKMRKMVVYPSILVMLVVLNPWLYRVIYAKVFFYAYWRALWMIPILPVIGIAFTSLVCRCRKLWQKCGAVFVLAGLVVLSGNNIYTTDLGRYASFTKAENTYKIPQAVIEVANELLALDAEPSVLLPSELLPYMRQYSGRIRLMYGRYSSGLYDGVLVKEVADLESGAPDLMYIFDRMKENDIRYMVYSDGRVSDEDMARYGFVKRSSVAGYGIYELDGEMETTDTGYSSGEVPGYVAAGASPFYVRTCRAC